MNSSPETCKNCSKELLNASHFCSNCGQSSKVFHKPFKSVVTDTLHESLDIDGRLMLTLKTLMLKPGELTFEYNQGKRVKYTPPLRMYLIISIIFFLVISQFERSTNLQLNDVYVFLPKMMFLFLPIFALLLQVLYRGTYYISNLVFSLHVHSFSYLALLIPIPLESFEATHMLIMLLQLPLLLYLFYYIFRASKLNFQQSGLKIATKTFALIFIYMGVLISAIELFQENLYNKVF
jgi:hypothetical protein